MDNVLKKQIDLKRLSPNEYQASWHKDWTVGTCLHGGCVAAQIHLAAVTHVANDPKLAARDQPDILSLHLEYLRLCELLDSTITVSVLKTGAASSTIQLQLSQKGTVRVFALATTTNFDKSLGPSASTDWSLHPAPKPKPDFDRVLAHQPDDNWIPSILAGEVIGLTRRMLSLLPRDGFPVRGICDAWNGFLGDERMDATYLAMMSDIIPSINEEWAEKNPGIPTPLTNKLSELVLSTTSNMTVTMDIEFKRRLPPGGQRWILTRTATKMMQGGRMDVETTLCNEQEEILSISRQVILVLEVSRKLRGGQNRSSL